MVVNSVRVKYKMRDASDFCLGSLRCEPARCSGRCQTVSWRWGAECVFP